MNILILTDEIYPYHIGGAGVVASQIAKILKARKIFFILKCTNPKNSYLRKIYNYTWPIWVMVSFLFSLIGKKDLIIVNDLRSAYILGLIGSKRVINKSVYIIHGTEVDIVFKNRSRKNSLLLLPFFYSRFLRNCQKIVFVSDYVAVRSKKEFSLHNIHPQNDIISYAGLSDEIYHLTKSSMAIVSEIKSPIRLVSFSRLEKRKGYLQMITIFESMLESGLDVVWDIYGTGSLKSTIEKIINDKGLENRITLRGKLDRNNIPIDINPNVYDAYWLLPIEPEAFGLTYLEAAAVGLPAIGLRKYGVTEAISESESGYFYETTEKLISDLVYIKNNKKSFMHSSKNWASNFDANNFIDKLLT